MISVVRRQPAECWRPSDDIVALETGSIGFSGAAEDDRRRWLNSFRRMIDGLDAPLQVVIEVTPGPDDDVLDTPDVPSDFDDMRGTDLAFADHIRRSISSHRVATSLVTADRQGARLVSVLNEMGIACTVNRATGDAFGAERASWFQHPRGFSRTWYIDRLPGAEVEPGWLFRLLPPRLALVLSWHAVPLPSEWIVNYLQRQLINMRATRLLDTTSGGSDPALAGAMPNAEDLQRRLASSQDKAFHVSVYLTLTSANIDALEDGSRKVEAAARAILCRLQPCTFRMLDGFLTTRPAGADRLQRKRVLDSTALVTFFPWNEPDLQQPRGLFVGRNAATGAPVLVDPFDQRRHANAKTFAHT